MKDGSPTSVSTRGRGAARGGVVALLACLAMLAGCGQKGPLTLPKAQAAASTPATPASAPAPR
jgi:predicted small lipoprotein YifL